MSGLLKKIKNNYHYIVLITYIAFLFYVHLYLKLNCVDDLPYFVAGNGSFSDIFTFLQWHFFNVNGRIIIHFLDILMMRSDCILWKILNPLMIAVSAILTAKLVENKKFTFKKSLVTSVILYSIIDFEIIRTTVYWISASMNYLWSFTLVLFIAYLLKEKKYKLYLPFIALFAGATMEQSGMVTIGLVFLVIIKNKFFDKEKVNINLIISFFASVIGFLSMLLSPGTLQKFLTIKTDTSSESFLSLFYNVYFIGNWMTKKAMIFTTVLSLAVVLMILYIQKSKNTLIGFHSAAALLLLILTVLNFIFKLCDYNYGKFYNLPLLAYIVLFVTLFIYSGIYFMIKFKSYIPVFSIILGIGSQVMMVVINLSVTRIMYAAVVCFLVYILYAVSLFEPTFKKAKIIPLIISIGLCFLSAFNSLDFIKSDSYEYVDIPKNFYSDKEKIEYIKNNDWYCVETFEEIISWF